VRFLLDEMHAPAVAERLRSLGVDAIAVKERPDLVGTSDADLLAFAAAEGRALVTENVKDFAVLDRHWAAAGNRNRHAGLVFTHPRRFPRAAGTYVRHLTDALALFTEEEAASFRRVASFVWWLERASR
jgi:uncharacterized protein DUF5615